MKPCKECGVTKPFSDFYVHARMADGHLNKCKPCVKARVMLHREKNVDRIRKYDRKRHYRDGPRNVSQGSSASKRAWAERNSERRKAHIAVGNAVRSGRLAKPDHCSRCSAVTPSRNLHGHHHDYSKPLDVEWICAGCHGLEHRMDGWEELAGETA